jgi:hypothetical protein
VDDQGLGPITALAVTAHPDRFPEGYGYLRETLALLEAGHLAATLALVLGRAGIGAATRFGTRGGTSVLLSLSGVGDDRGVPAAAVRGLDSSTAPAEAPLSSWLDRRSSGWSRENLVTSEPPGDEAVKAVSSALVDALAAVRDVLPHDDSLRLYEHSLIGDSLGRREVRQLGGEYPTRALIGDVSFVSSVGYSLVADLDAWLDAYGSDASTVLHTVAGWVTQWGCLASASRDTTARPMRNFVEAEWGHALAFAPRYTVCYQLWLRPWPAEPVGPAFWSLQGVPA